MFPVLLSFGGITVSTMGFFLALGFLLALFLVWRLSRAWDLDEEKTLDLTLLTFLGGLIGARLFFAGANFSYFSGNLLNVLLFYKAPGFSFMGGFLGGWLTLFFFARRFKADFWQFSDIALVGFFGSLILADLGCFFGACNVGTVTKSFLGVSMTGMIGRRWPVQLFEALLLLVIFFRVWASATHFHQRGKIAALGFIYIGIIKLILLPLRQNQKEAVSAVILTVLGLTLFYLVTKQSPLTHIKKTGSLLPALFLDPVFRKKVVQKIGKYCYNQKTNFFWRLRSLKKLLRRSNVKFS